MWWMIDFAVIFLVALFFLLLGLKKSSRELSRYYAFCLKTGADPVSARAEYSTSGRKEEFIGGTIFFARGGSFTFRYERSYNKALAWTRSMSASIDREVIFMT